MTNTKLTAYKTDISAYIPGDVVLNEGKNPFLSNLIVTKVGFFDKAYRHNVTRDGIPEYIVIYCINGNGWVKSECGKWDIKKGDVIFLDKDIPHSYGAYDEEPWSIHWVHFIGEAVPDLYKLLDVTPRAVVQQLGVKPELISLIIEAYDILSTGYGFVNILEASTYFQQFLCKVVRLKIYSGISGNRNMDIEKVLLIMKNNIKNNCTLKQLADSVNMSKYHFARLFKQIIGYTPIEYYNRLKIQKACELLDTTDCSNKEISDNLSFSSPFYFSETFKRITGCSPKEYKRLHQERNTGSSSLN